MSRLRRALAALTAAAAVVTLLVAVVPALHLAYRAPRLHTALETASSLVALLAAFLVVGRVGSRARSTDLLVASALGLLAVSGALYGFAAASSRQLGWDGRLVGVLGALLLAAAALAPRRALRRPARAATLAVGSTAAVAGAVAVVVGLLGDRLPSTAAAVERAPTWPSLHGQPAVAVLHVVAALGFAVAAVGFVRRSERAGDGFLAWLAAAAVLAAFASVNYALFPTRYTDWVYTGDGFRFCFYLVLLAGALWEIGSYWSSLAAAAVGEERRRIARDLHDGLAQELAYIGRNLAALDGLEGEAAERRARLLKAVERAQVESRQTVAALSAPADEPLDLLLARSVEAVAERAGVALTLELAAGIHLSPPRTEAVVRIACEAVNNAARHSGAGAVRVTLERVGGGARLLVSDDGRGFDPAVENGGFGLTSMRERAHAVGAEVAIDSGPDRGTAVEVVLG